MAGVGHCDSMGIGNAGLNGFGVPTLILVGDADIS
jgi:hypothetical protein